MSDRPEPPPFRGASSDGKGRSWEEEYLGKRPDETWAEHFGVGGRTGGFSGPENGAPRGENPFRSPNPHKFYRNKRDGKVGGVCAGFADYVGVEPWLVRVGALIGLFFFPPVFFLGYLALWFALKRQPDRLYESREEEVFWRSVTTKPDQTLAGLKAKFRDLDRQIADLETHVASREFDLRRQFRDLETK